MTQNSATVRISPEYRDILRQLAKESGTSMQATLEEAIEQYQRTKLFEELDLACQKLKQDPEAWKEELAERRMWDATLSDGLEEE